MEVSPYVDWLVLRKLVSDNNKVLSSKFANKCGREKENFSNGFKIIAENFMSYDPVAYETYKYQLKGKDWINHLSADSLFCLYNYQNKILEVDNFYDVETVASTIIDSNMNLFEKRVSFKGKPKKQPEDEKNRRQEYSTDLVKEVLLNHTEESIKIVEEKYNKKVSSLKIFDKNIGLNLGKFHNIVSFDYDEKAQQNIVKELEKIEQERLTRETEEKEKKEQPYLPGFEEELERLGRK